MAWEHSWSAAMGEREEGMVGVKAHTLENELLSFKAKSHMMGKQRSGTTLWQRLVSDFSLRTTTAFGSFWEGRREPGMWIKRKMVCGSRKRSRGEEEGEREERYGHGSPVLASSRKVHWNSCSDSCHLFSCSLVPGVHLSAFTVCSTWQKGRRLIKSPAARNRFLSQVTYFKRNSQYQLWISPSMDKAASVSHWQI